MSQYFTKLVKERQYLTDGLGISKWLVPIPWWCELTQCIMKLTGDLQYRQVRRNVAKPIEILNL